MNRRAKRGNIPLFYLADSEYEAEQNKMEPAYIGSNGQLSPPANCRWFYY